MKFNKLRLAASVAFLLPVAQAVAQEQLESIVIEVPAAPGGGFIPIEKVPGAVTVVEGKDFEAPNNTQSDIQNVLAKKVPGVLLIDAGGSNIRAQVDYRGFGAGSITGFPQGLAVYQEGIRINEVFGDVVNWDLIPTNAISDIAIVSGNPIYGLNALGGAAVINMKDGFGFEGVEIEAIGGSYGYKEIGTQIGVKHDTFALYFAGQHIDEDGWRDFSPAEVDRMYTDLGMKGSRVEAHFNLTWADSSAGVTTATPEELLNISLDRTFTSPQDTDLEVLMPSINAEVKVNDTLSLVGLTYYRRFNSSVIDGNLLEADDDDDDGDDLPPGVIDRINQKAEGWGGSLQAIEKRELFSRPNQFILGASYDRGNVKYNTSSEEGVITSRYVVVGNGETPEGDDFLPRNVDVNTEYFGLYFTNTLEVTDRLAVTVGGRYNYAQLDLEDLTGDFSDITSSTTYERFNPNVGATYELGYGTTVYAGYSEANRAPTPGEQACAEATSPCPIESFLTDDPPLDQVVSRTVEAGFRGEMGSTGGDQSFNWQLGYFRTENEDDILFVTSAEAVGRGFFFNGGNTLRQGLEARIDYQWRDRLSLYATYAFVHATFEDSIEFQSPAHPDAVQCSNPDLGEVCIFVSPGDQLPNVPEHRVSAGFEYMITDRWMFGADLIASGGQFFLGDEINTLPKVGGYTRVDLKTSYKVAEQVEFFGYINNVFDREYGLFGVLFEPDEVPGEDVPPDFVEFTNPRSIVPAQPVAAYGGVRMRF